MPGEWAEGLSPILNHETRHALKLFAVAGYQGGPKAKSLGRDEGIEHSNRRLRDGEPQLPVGIHGTVIEREYGEWCHHLGEQMFVPSPKLWLTRCMMLDPVSRKEIQRGRNHRECEYERLSERLHRRSARRFHCGRLFNKRR